MKHLLVLIDFTPTANIALDQAMSLAKQHSAKISMCYIAGSEDDGTEEALRNDLKPYSEKAEKQGITVDTIIGQGNLFDEVGNIVKELKPDLVVVGTHGRHGIRQNLFGSAIHKLVKSIPAPTLVVNDHSRLVSNGFKKVMLPVAAHADYLIKVRQTCEILVDDALVVIYAVIKPDGGLDEEVVDNIEATKKYLDEKGVKWEYLEENADLHAVGYSNQTLASMKEKNMDLISIMANVSSPMQWFGKMDKENVLLNEQGLTILCANH